ncbi:glycosyltransferase family 1 protein [Trichocladium antarcticum]|uniref:UDP-N-acetylglucosamine transferase subunit ALG13 n=1 Tax=Trichocladium antarcticum TaxID=1450529 RepID=A0AAN6UJW4_9PEZI|nr:glycosyltransferase family 1 protein [Trichocladium antarcticum]
MGILANGVGEDEGEVSGVLADAHEREIKRQRFNHHQNGQTHRNAEHTQLRGRHCFATVGATAGFRALLEELSTPGFLQSLAAHGFTALDVQCGPDLEFFRDRIVNLSNEETHGVAIRYFGYTETMRAHMLACRGELDVRLSGCVIAHAGTGTVLEAQSVGAPLIVVANPTLMDNHQVELAEELEALNWAVHGHIGNLAAAIERILERIAQGTLDALPPYTPPSFPVSAADRVTLFDWMVLTCYPDELAHQQHLADLRGEGPMTNGDGANQQEGEGAGMLQLD